MADPVRDRRQEGGGRQTYDGYERKLNGQGARYLPLQKISDEDGSPEDRQRDDETRGIDPVQDVQRFEKRGRPAVRRAGT